MKIEKLISILRPELTKLIETYKDQIETFKEQIQILIKLSSKFDQNWAGAWASPVYNFYYDFTTGNSSKIAIDEDKMLHYIESESGVSFGEIQNTIPTISRSYREFQNKLLTELSIIKTLEEFNTEAEILEKLEHYEWGMSPMDYIKMKQPKTVYTYNHEELLNKGLNTPPHINIGGEFLSLFSHLVSLENFEKNTIRLLRQLEIKLSIEQTPINKSEFIVKIINNFHVVASQLRNRYHKRNTLLIEDEYDVQDLLNGLMHLEFDDIRPEEYTPSYAGSSTRMDFLIKKEKIVIEVKKTREGLKDKEVGDQLILDVQHYKAHPDCKRLICFIYDPENRIKNPRGLEADLVTLSSDSLLVEVYIRP